MKALLSILSLLTVAALAAPVQRDVIIVSLPKDQSFPAASQSEIYALIYGVPDTGAYRLGTPARSSNTVTTIEYQDYIVKEFQTGQIWDANLFGQVKSRIKQLDPKDSTVEQNLGYGQFLEDNNRVRTDTEGPQ